MYSDVVILSYQSCAEMLIVMWSYIPNNTLEILVEDRNVKHNIKITQTIGCPSNIYYMFKMYCEILHDVEHDPLAFHCVTIYY